MTWVRALAAVSLLFVSFAPLMSAEREQLRIRSVFVDPDSQLSAIVELPGEPFPKPSEFQLSIDDKPVAAARETSGLDLNIMFLVDVSGSMKGPPLNDAKNALLSFLDKARQQDQFALSSFADQDRSLSSFKDSREQINVSVRNLRIEGSMTRLYQALDNALKKDPKDDQRTRRILVVVSDGKDEGSEVKLEQVIADSNRALVPIYTVFRGKTEPPFRAILDLLANAAGGKYFFTRNERELASALDEIYQLEKNSVVVGFTYQRDKAGGTTENAVVELRRPDGTLLTAKFPERIPVPLGRSSIVPWLFGLLLALLLSAWAIWFWQRSRRAEQQPEEPLIVPVVTEPEINPPPPPPPLRATTVISRYFPDPTAGKTAAVLRGVSGAVEGQQFSVDKEIFSIGASAENNLPIGEDQYISREHAYLRYEQGSLFIFDKASRNGTFVNEDKVTQTGVVLRPGDRIRVGASIFEVVMPSG